MTLVSAWIRRSGNAHEAVMASDSRLSGGFALDGAQKILPVCGGRFALAFSGDANVSYPLFIHALTFSESYGRAQSGALDVSDFAEKLQSIFQNYANQLRDAVETPAEFFSRTHFVLVGWSWKFSGFKMYHYRFTCGAWEKGRVVPTSWKTAGGKVMATFKMIGTNAPKVVSEMRADIAGRTLEAFDLEPLEFLWDRLEHLRSTGAGGSVGGAIQVVKCYPYLRALPFAVSWPDDKNTYLAGRKIEPYEKVEYPIVGRTVEGFTTSYPQVIHGRSARDYYLQRSTSEL